VNSPERKPGSGPPSHCRAHRFHEDDFGQLLADGEPGIADLADVIGLAGKQPNNLVFAEAEFAQAFLHLRRGAKLLNPNSHTGLDAAEGAHLAAQFVSWRHPIHNGLTFRIATDSHYTCIGFS